MKIFAACCWVLLPLIGLSAEGRAAPVTLTNDKGTWQVHAGGYDATVEPDGCLTHFKAHGQDFLFSKPGVSRGAYFWQKEVFKLSAPEQQGDGVLSSKSDRAGVRYTFAGDQVTMTVTNSTASPLAFFMILDPGMTGVIGDNGFKGRPPVAGKWARSTWLSPKATFVVTGGDRQWGPWGNNSQVWEADLKPGETRDVVLVPGTPTADQLQTAAAVASPEAALDLQTLDAIHKGVDYLLGELHGGDHWTATAANKGYSSTNVYHGQTPLALYALLHVGHGLDDPRLTPESKELAPVVKYMAGFVPELTYDAGLTTNALSFLKLNKDKSYRDSMQRSARFLETMLHTKRDGAFWYSNKIMELTRNRVAWDNSNTQYGVLGLWAAVENGEAEVSQSDWNEMETHWRKTQNADGGWGYDDGKQRGSRPSMSVAGLASMYITQQYTDLALHTSIKEDKTFTLGLGWLDKNFSPNWDLYTMYGVERVGLSSGYKFFGTHDWFQEGAKAIAASQLPDGHWAGGFVGGDNTVAATSYALLFLARGRNPVVFNKLKYAGNTWNARPRDDANVTAFLSRQLEQGLNWQVVNLDVPVEQLLDAPVLLITGPVDPKFTDEQVAKLKAFVRRGGLIFSSTDGNSPAFTRAMGVYAAAMVDGRSELKPVSKDDPLFRLHEPVRTPLKLEVLTNGVRPLWVHSRQDLGAAWQRNARATSDDSFILAANLYDDVVGKDGSTLRDKLNAMRDPPSTPVAPARQVSVARVQYAGNWDPEPAGWDRMARVAANDFATGVKVAPVKADQLNAKAAIAHLTGTAAFTLSPAEVAGVRAYVRKGGTLFIDAAGGKNDFANSVEVLVKSLALGGGLEPIPESDPLLTGGPGGSAKIEKFHYSSQYVLEHGGRKGPDLLGVKVNGRWGVIFSPGDVSAALVGLHTYGISGYKPETARAIVGNLLAEAAK